MPSQVKYVGTIKYFQKSLSFIAASTSDFKKTQFVRKQKVFLQNIFISRIFGKHYMKKIVIRFLIFYLNVRVFFTMRKWQILTVLNLYQRMAFFSKKCIFLSVETTNCNWRGLWRRKRFISNTANEKFATSKWLIQLSGCSYTLWDYEKLVWINA